MSHEIGNLDPRCHFRESHEWARPFDGNGSKAEFEIGITPHAENALGDVVFVELPAVGTSFKMGEAFGIIESVKAASELYMPLSGTISSVNVELVQNPALVNRDPWKAGWIVKIQASQPNEWNALLDAHAYSALLSENGKS